MSGIVIVGGGQAGFSIAARLREKGYDGAVTIICEEPELPYQRPPLSKKYLTGDMERERLYFRPADYFAEHNITLHLGVRVEKIDPAAREIHFDGQVLGYDKLALATGADPRTLPRSIGGDLGGVHYVRNLTDVDSMAARFVPGAKVLIVGGGYIGLEAAAVAASGGLDVTLVEAAPRILQRVAAEQTADYFRDLHSAHGVRILEGAGLDQLEGDTTVERAILTDGITLDIDFLIAGIGILPRTELAEAAGLSVENGIVVDALCRSSDPDIYAAGDCASFPYQGQQLRLESVPNAADQGIATADAMLGGTAPYVARPWFWSDQYDVKLQIAGLHHGYDKVVSRAGSKPGSASFWYYCKDKLVAVDAANEPVAYMFAKRWIESGKSPSQADIADAARPLKDIEVI